jgi:hypothetical protein
VKKILMYKQTSQRTHTCAALGSRRTLDFIITHKDEARPQKAALLLRTGVLGQNSVSHCFRAKVTFCPLGTVLLTVAPTKKPLLSKVDADLERDSKQKSNWHLIKTQAWRAGGVTQVEECLPSNH